MKNAIPGMDALRSLAFLLVYWFHVQAILLKGVLAQPNSLIAGGYEGVTLFFVLSGFLLSMPFWRALRTGTARPALGPFFRKRALRILPAYYASLLVFSAFIPSTYSRPGLVKLVAHLFFLHTLTDYTYHSINEVYWSLGVEVQFYLILPLIFAGLAWLGRGREARTRLGIAAWGLGALGLLVALNNLFIWPSVAAKLSSGMLPVAVVDPIDSAVLGSTILTLLLPFLFGLAAAALYQRTVLHTADAVRSGHDRAWLGLGLGALIGAALLMAHDPARTTTADGMVFAQHSLALPLCFAVLVLGVSLGGTAWPWLDRGPLKSLGLVSYSAYLLHAPLLRVILRGSIWDGWSFTARFWGAGAVALLLTYFMSVLFYKLIEYPYLSRKSKVAVPVMSAAQSMAAP